MMLRSQGIKIGLDEETLKTFYLLYWCKSLTEKSKTSIVCLLNRRYDQLGAQWEKSLKKKESCEKSGELAAMTT